MNNVEKEILKIKAKKQRARIQHNMNAENRQKKKELKKKKVNPRRTNSSKRNKLRQRIRMQNRECALCGQPIDYTLPARHPWSYELDEIIPVSKGGDPYDINNVQPVHRTCNLKKGNKIISNKSNPTYKEKHSNIFIGQIKHSKEW